ncbi:hypothetical protein AVCANL279_04675 [Campylobacter canadensis]|uniref:NADH-quinone oxidoreductase subunit N n=1 Tax=Campylobacter canadensis TaxID=449520 RepID=UPI0015556592|nr:proton-conducting transporter membrane subunit [Campylobacter canadensis]MBZ7995097.1 hypothetical protein [Campylobacter canadensis]MBZ7996621.1 hypothetical protein [Campylobacter canadensis]MBZ8000466.1 hypothetical protein [Campylobacter canadensis]MBZ8001947.1 hypothetical protein [Campylobacter canadensis]MBZ8004417.1 hypothetical protein [Campylobacter canadensis]
MISSELNFSLLLPYLLPTFAACVLLLFSKFFTQSALKSVSILSIVLNIIFIFNQEYNTSFFNLLSFTKISQYAIILIASINIYYILSIKNEYKSEFYALLLFMLTCFSFLVSTKNLIMIFVCLEGSSLALYSLIAFKKSAIKASLKYFNYGMISSAFFAFGSAMYYYSSADLNIEYIELSSPVQIIAFAMIGATILFKLSVAPFHLWLKDVYLKSDTLLAGFISVAPKSAIIIVANILLANAQNSFAFCIIAAFSMLFASFMSLKQTDAKSMLVLSSISHSSFALIIATISNQGAYLNYALFYFISFAFVNLAVFLILSSFKSTKYEDINGFFKAYPLYAIALVVLLLNLAAIPPFGVFFAKVLAIYASLKFNFIIALCMALSSLIMLFAYLKFIKAIFADSSTKYFIYFTNTQKALIAFSIIVSFISSLVLNYI